MNKRVLALLILFMVRLELNKASLAGREMQAMERGYKILLMLIKKI